MVLTSSGQRVGEHYRLKELLGSGGMGEVWEAESEVHDEPVAIKFLLERVAHRKDIQERFRREAEATARVQSRYVCQLLDKGLTAEGGMYLVFELLRGESLAARIQRERFLPLREMLPITIDVLRGVEHAHDAHVLHRDLKPGNVFLSAATDGTEQAVILDFGVSKIISQVRGMTEPTLTAYHGTVGSFAYMAPEQVRGAARVDERADIYAVGSMMFRALAGRLPFDGTTAKMVASRKLATPPPTLQQVTGLLWPKSLETFMRKCLSRVPDRRYPTAAAARSALEQLQASVDEALMIAEQRLDSSTSDSP